MSHPQEVKLCFKSPDGNILPTKDYAPIAEEITFIRYGRGDAVLAQKHSDVLNAQLLRQTEELS